MAKWLELCPPDLKTDKGGILLCSKHFRRDQYLNINAKRPKLVHNAVPFKKRIAKNTHTQKSEKFTEPPVNLNSMNQLKDKHVATWPLEVELIEDSLEQTDDNTLENELEDSSSEENSVIFEVHMTDDNELDSDDVSSCEEVVKDEKFGNQTIVNEIVHYRMKNENLKTQLEKCKKRLLFLEKHVHNLSQLAGEHECKCSSCTEIG